MFDRTTASSRLLVVICLALAVGCGVGGTIGGGIAAYREGNFTAAMKRWQEVAGKEGGMNQKGRVRYLVYRGLTHYRMGHRPEAAKFLGRGKLAYAQGDPGWLPAYAVAQMRQALSKLGAASAPLVGRPVAPPKPTAAPPPVPAGPPAVGAPPPTNKRGTPAVVAVFDIREQGAGIAPAMLDRLTDYLAARVAATGAYQVIPRSALKERLVAQKKSSYKQCYDQSCQIEVGRELAAQKSLQTVVAKIGSTCTVTMVLYDLKKSTSEGGASADGRCTEDDILASIKRSLTDLARLP